MRPRSLLVLATLLASLAPAASASAVQPVWQVGSTGPGAGQYLSPFGLGSDAAGTIYVADSGAYRISELSPADGSFKLAFGADVVPGGGTGFESCTAATTCKAGLSGAAAGQFGTPFDVASNAAGDRLYVNEIANSRISQVNATPNFVNAWGYDVIPGGSPGLETCTAATTCQAGTGGLGAGQLTSPYSDAVGSNGNVYVVNSIGTVGIYGPDGSLVRSFGFPGNGPGNMSSPQGIGVDSAGDVIVADTGNNRIDVFSPGGAFVRAFSFDTIPGGGIGLESCTVATNCQAGNSGPAAGQLSNPGDLTIGPQDQIYVTDRGNNRVSQFTVGGDFVQAFGFDVVPGGGTGFETCTAATTCKAGTTGAGTGQFQSLIGITTDCRGAIYTSDNGNYRVTKFADAGTANPPCPAAQKPSNAFSFGKVKLNKKKGTATLPVKLPGAGSLSLSGKGLKPIKRAERSAAARAVSGGTVKLAVKPKGKQKKKLASKGKLKVKVTVTFTPSGGDPNAQAKKLTLKKSKQPKKS